MLQRSLLALLLCCLAPALRAENLEIPVTLDLAVVEDALRSQLFTRDGRAEIMRDSIQCNRVVLSSPELASTEDGLLRLTTRLDAQVGTPLGNRCLLPFRWEGVIETLEQVEVGPGQQLSFRVVDSRILRADEQRRALPGLAWDWVKGHVHPRLGAVRINLDPAVTDLRAMLRDALPAAPEVREAVASSLSLKHAALTRGGLQVSFALQVPPVPDDWQPAAQPALSAEELARWDAAWQAWDGFATWFIKDLARDAAPPLREGLAELLVEARYALRDALVEEQVGNDAVRQLFLDVWERLAPLLRDHTSDLPGGRSLQLATFLGAGDALRAIDQAAPQLGLNLDNNTLRRLARLLSPSVSDEELGRPLVVDPSLRQLLGLDPVLEEAPAAASAPFAWLVSRAQAAGLNPALVERLTLWAPSRSDLDSYLPLMEQLIDEAIRAEWQRGKVPTPYFDLYQDLVRATAWQETCWRHFVRHEGEVRPIQSSAGSVGLMQINQHVWRGIYDLDRLREDVGYNARAGNEILAHYLVDYAIRRGEHEVRGDIHDLAFATYAVYNGGPRHLTRYRDPGKSNDYLRSVDAAFRDKYRAIRAQGFVAVKACYGQ